MHNKYRFDENESVYVFVEIFRTDIFSEKIEGKIMQFTCNFVRLSEISIFCYQMTWMHFLLYYNVSQKSGPFRYSESSYKEEIS